METNDSKWYDKEYAKENNELSAWNQKILEIVNENVKKKSTIIDLGCGKGILLKTIRGKLGIPLKNLNGIDISKMTIEKLKQEGFTKVKQGTIENLPYKDNTFDIIILAETIEHLRNKDKGLKEIERTLKKDGKLILSFPNYLNIPWLMVLGQKSEF